MKVFPENIDDIESFYKGELHEDAIEPPIGLWESISAQLPPAPVPVPPMPPAGSFLGVTAKTWFISSIITASLVGGYVSYKTTVAEKKITKVKPVMGSVPKDSITPVSPRTEDPTGNTIEKIKTENSTSDKPAEVEYSSGQSDLLEDQSNRPIENVLPIEENQAVPVSGPAVDEESSKQDNVDLELVSPKMNQSPGVKSDSKDQHKSFFDKKTAQLKDSARPLFVPKKK